MKNNKYTVWQNNKTKKRYSKNQRYFIQAVISSNYVFFSQYHVLKESQTLCSGTIKLAKTKRSKFNVTDAKFKLEFSEDMATLKDKEGTR